MIHHSHKQNLVYISAKSQNIMVNKSNLSSCSTRFFFCLPLLRGEGGEMTEKSTSSNSQHKEPSIWAHHSITFYLILIHYFLDHDNFFFFSSLRSISFVQKSCHFFLSWPSLPSVCMEPDLFFSSYLWLLSCFISHRLLHCLWSIQPYAYTVHSYCCLIVHCQPLFFSWVECEIDPPWLVFSASHLWPNCLI